MRWISLISLGHSIQVHEQGREELLHIPGKEQWLCFAGAAVKGDPTSKARETQERQQVLRENQRADRQKL